MLGRRQRRFDRGAQCEVCRPVQNRVRPARTERPAGRGIGARQSRGNRHFGGDTARDRTLGTGAGTELVRRRAVPRGAQIPFASGRWAGSLCEKSDTNTNRYGQLHDIDNLFVADGSLHVTNGGFNPVLTIMALGCWVPAHVRREWRGSRFRYSRSRAERPCPAEIPPSVGEPPAYGIVTTNAEQRCLPTRR